jgi:DNA-binding SARP family transcriptional activator
LTDLDFRLLGPLRVLVSGEPRHVGGPRQQIVLTTLLLEANRVVPVERLIEAVWGEDPPATARAQIQMAVWQLRRRFAEWTDAELIVSYPAGYAIEVPGSSMDMLRFDHAVAAGREAVRRGEIAGAVKMLRDALEMWRGSAAAGVHSRVVEAAVLRLDEQRLGVLEECLDLELRLGRHHEVIGELKELVRAYPLREGLHAHLMLALYRAGRQAEALAAYREAHRVLTEEYGLDPGEQLAALERAILTNDPALNKSDAASVMHPVPRQLPAAVSDFVGRDDIAGELCARLTDASAAQGQSVEVIIISGAGGIGKTALALHVAHQVRESFPEGQLYARLRGVDGRPVRPKQVLEEFLRSLGVSPTALPEGLGELSAEYRSRLSGSRILVVLDDVVTVDQIEPLVPGEAGCAVIATSRRALAGVPGARRIELDVLDLDASLTMLSRVIGPERVHSEPHAATRLAEACARLPLALRIAASKLSVRPHWTIDRMLDRLSDEQRLLDELALEGVGVRASIAFSYRELTKPAQRLLLLLSMLGATDFSEWVAAPLLETDVDAGADTLQELSEASLVVIEATVGRQPRYRLHELVRIFAQEMLAREVPLEERVEAQTRLLRAWLFMATEAHSRSYGGDYSVLHADCDLWPLPSRVVNELMVKPMDWFAAEHANLVTAVELAAQLGQADLCWDLAITSVTLFEARGYTDSWARTHAIALEVCRTAGDRRGEAAMWYSSGELAIFEDRILDGRREDETALGYFDEIGDVHGRGLTLRSLAFIDRIEGHLDAALATYQHARADLQAASDRIGEVHVLEGMAQVHLDRGDHAAAAKLLDDALSASLAIGATRAEAQVRHRLGYLYLAQERFSEAESEFAAVRRAAAELGDPVGTTYAHLGMGLVHLARDEWASAESALRDARAVADNSGDRLSLGRVLLAQAEVAIQAGDLAVAAELVDQGRSVFTAANAALWLERTAQFESRLRNAERRAGRTVRRIVDRE